MRKKRYCTKQPLSATIASPGYILLNIQVSKTFTKKCTFYIWPLPPPLPKKKIYLCTKASVQSSVYISNETRQAFMKLKQGNLLKGRTGFGWVYLNSFFFAKCFVFNNLAVKCYSWLNALWWGNKLDPRFCFAFPWMHFQHIFASVVLQKRWNFYMKQPSSCVIV